ncbi:hypothetical protein LJY25_10050 [Hymenobacter sp. BT175]|uniref:hypothetical protein n=1 Tax=Hymenobacter translucens TaxID=2886507 RepID=UPI001D0EEF6B|nr:hypothetical protein [Hymenobacter translucens]MCC2546785.1 hypothetical protein [Hymenobacter translucens]
MAKKKTAPPAPQKTPETAPTPTPEPVAAPRPPVDTTGEPAPAPGPQTAAAANDDAVAVVERLTMIYEGLMQKSTAKQAIFRNTSAAFELLKQVSMDLSLELSRRITPQDANVVVEYRSVNEMEFHIRFSGDLLVFVMHSNIVTFPDDYGPMSTPYVEADFRRRFFGHIMAYNFMADSIKYQRLNDPGYLVGRLLINIDNHFYIEGVQQLELPDHDMADNYVTPDALKLFVESAMIAAVNNDLIAPPLKEIQKISVKQKIENQQVSRASKVGFSFYSQQNQVE